MTGEPLPVSCRCQDAGHGRGRGSFATVVRRHVAGPGGAVRAGVIVTGAHPDTCRWVGGICTGIYTDTRGGSRIRRTEEWVPSAREVEFLDGYLVVGSTGRCVPFPNQEMGSLRVILSPVGEVDDVCCVGAKGVAHTTSGSSGSGSAGAAGVACVQPTKARIVSRALILCRTCHHQHRSDDQCPADGPVQVVSHALSPARSR